MQWSATQTRARLRSGRFAIAGSTIDAIDPLIIQAKGPDGTIGRGEATISPRVLGIDATGLQAAFHDIQPLLVRTTTGADGPPPMVAAPIPSPLACGIDAALLDHWGRTHDTPAHQALDLPQGKRATSATVSLDTPERMAEEAKTLTDAGFHHLKLKLGGPPNTDLARVHAVHDACPRAALRVDGNEAWNLDDAVSLVPGLAEAGVILLEQPLPRNASRDTLAKLTTVCRDFELPHYLDEPIHNAADVERIAGSHIVDGVNIKLQKAGGPRAAAAAVQAARAHDLHVLLGCFIETWVGIAAALPLVGSVDHVDLDGAWLLGDPPFLADPPVLDDGMIGPSDAPGLGVRPA